jgi:hypothetical protein
MMIIVALLGMIPAARAVGIGSDVQRPLAKQGATVAAPVKVLLTFFDATDEWGGSPLREELVRQLERQGVADATVLITSWVSGGTTPVRTIVLLCGHLQQRHFFREVPVNRQVPGQFRMESCGHVQTLFHPDGIPLVFGPDKSAAPCTADNRGADEHGFYLSIGCPQLCNAAINLTAIRVAFHIDVHQTQADLFRMGDMLRKQDCSCTCPVDGVALTVRRESIEQVFDP